MNIKELFKSFLRLFPLNKMIVFESNPAFACNTYPVYKKILKALPSYTCVWIIHDRKMWHNEPNAKVIYDGADKTFKEKVLYGWCMERCKVLVTCNKFKWKRNPKQLSLFLSHGSKTKKTRGIYSMGPAVDYINVQSHFFDDIIICEYDCKKEQLVYLGYPRCD